MTRFVKSVAAIALAAVVVSCGSNSNSAAPASLRFVNATTNQSLSVTMNGNGQFSHVAATSATGYAHVVPSNYTISVTSDSGALASSTQIQGIASSQTYTLLAYQRNNAIVASLIIEDQAAPPSGYSTVAASNSSPDAGTLDVYVVTPGTTNLAGLSPNFQFVVYGAAPVATTLVAGTFDVVATGTGNPNDVRSRLSSVQIPAGEILMAAYTSTSGGALVNSVLLTQGGSVALAPTTEARVRVVSGLPSTPATPVTATVGSASVPPAPGAVYAPNPGSYTLVPGGSSSYSVSIGGTPIANLPGATFTTGGDFTILVYGSTASAGVAVFTDNNQAPVGSNVNLRLINAAVGGPVGVTMYANNIQVASGVLYAQASPYYGVIGSTISTLQLIAPGMVSPNFPFSFNTPGAVYTVFVFDPTLAQLIPPPVRDR